MPPQLISLIIFGVQQLIQHEPEIAAQIHALLTKAEPTADDWKTLHDKVAAKSYRDYVPASALPAEVPQPVNVTVLPGPVTPPTPPPQPGPATTPPSAVPDAAPAPTPTVTSEPDKHAAVSITPHDAPNLVTVGVPQPEKGAAESQPVVPGSADKPAPAQSINPS